MKADDPRGLAAREWALTPRPGAPALDPGVWAILQAQQSGRMGPLDNPQRQHPGMPPPSAAMIQAIQTGIIITKD